MTGVPLRYSDPGIAGTILTGRIGVTGKCDGVRGVRRGEREVHHIALMHADGGSGEETEERPRLPRRWLSVDLHRVRLGGGASDRSHRSDRTNRYRRNQGGADQTRTGHERPPSSHPIRERSAYALFVEGANEIDEPTTTLIERFVEPVELMLVATP